MNDAADRRTSPRFAVNLQVTLQSGENVEVMAENISLGGVFLAVPDGACDQGDRVTLQLVLPASGDGDPETVSVPAIVAHAVPPIGAGLRFEALPDDVAGKLQSYLDRLASVQEALA